MSDGEDRTTKCELEEDIIINPITGDIQEINFYDTFDGHRKLKLQIINNIETGKELYRVEYCRATEKMKNDSV